MNILFYTPFSLRSRDTESLMIAFKKSGHRVFFVTQQEGYPIRTFLEASGIETFSFQVKGKIGILYYLKQLYRFVRFCRKNNIDVVYSHLEAANFIAAIGQYCVRAKVYICRHHINEAALFGFDKSVSYRLTYFLARKIIVVSQHAVEYMIEREKIPARKLIHINLAYDFSLYQGPHHQNVKEIRDRYQSDILLVFIGRLLESKRPKIAVHLLENLLKLDLDAKLVMLGSGAIESQVASLVEERKLGDRVLFAGYVGNPLEYLSAADYLVHPSIAEASCVVTKEAGLTETPIIVCKGVGDFDAYLVDRENAFIVDASHFVEQATTIISQTHQKKELLSDIGAKLKESVVKNFSIDQIVNKYETLNRK